MSEQEVESLRNMGEVNNARSEEIEMLYKKSMGIVVIVASLAVALIVFLTNLGNGLKTAAGYSALSGGSIYLFGMAGRWMFWRDEEWENDEE